jgi:signal peptidase I
MVDKLWCSPANLKRNDIVVYRGEGQKLLITRLVGLPGDEIQVKEEQLFVNGSRCEDQHAFFNGSSTHLPPELVNYGPIKVPLDSFFVLGDNRRISIDSRRLGPIPLSKLHGKAFVIFWSQEMTNLAPLNSSEYPLGPIRWDRIGRRLD